MDQSDETRVRFRRTVSFLLAWFAFIVAVVGLSIRFAPVVNHLELLVAALSPYLIFAALPAFALLWRNGQKRFAVLALVPLVVGVGLKIPDYLQDSHSDRETIPIRVLTINLNMGSAEDAAVAAAAREHADVVLMQELTPGQASGIAAEPGVQTDFPYSALAPHPQASGVGILSRHPIVQNSRITRYQLGALTATLRPGGAAADVVVATIHLSGPWPQPIDRWREDIEALPRTLQQLALQADPGAAIVGGDFNATRDFLPYRQLLDSGFADAVEQAGGGLGRTYPSDSLIPPIIGIDHILTYNGWASDSHQVPIAGTDHMALVATVHVPASS